MGKMYRTKLASLIIPAVFTVAPSSLAHADCKNERGLLHGIQDVSNAREYSRRIISTDAAALLRDGKHLYNCALEDAHRDVQVYKRNLDEIIQKAIKFQENQGQVWDREELQDVLKIVLPRNGRFEVTVGGKDTGKTSVIENVDVLHTDSMYVVDLRRLECDTLQGLLAVLELRRSHFQAESEPWANREYQHIYSVLYPNTAAVVFITGYLADLTEMYVCTANLESVEDLMASFSKVRRGKRGKVTFIIDEANIAFTKEKGGEARTALALFAKLTKQDEQV